MITVKKGIRTQALHDDIQVAAFEANGWEVVKTAAVAKQEEPKAPKTPKNIDIPQKPTNSPEKEQGQEPEQKSDADGKANG